MEKKFDVLVIGELNVDIILHNIDIFPEVGKEVLAQQMTLTLGSSSAIFASNISGLGASVAFLGKIGKDEFGDIVLHDLRKQNVDVSMIQTDNQLSTGATIVLSVKEDRANITYPGAMDHLTINDISEDDLSKAKHVHFSSYFMQPGFRGDLGKLFRRCKELGLTTSFDMQWDPHEKWDLNIKDVLPYVDVFFPNEQELLLLTAKNNIPEAIDSIKKYVKTLAIKRGNQGSVVFYDGNLKNMPSFLNKKVIDTTGAGDSFNAGFILKYINGNSIPECQEFGNLMGAVSTTAAGGVKAFTNFENVKNIAKNKFGIIL
ncbi:MAG: carbohydrate kinase family protein [Bacteroidetes bacterium]|nr:MAG: carbohydrate kinase family protein [Bacteroidota bacterium]